MHWVGFASGRSWLCPIQDRPRPYAQTSRRGPITGKKRQLRIQFVRVKCGEGSDGLTSQLWVRIRQTCGQAIDPQRRKRLEFGTAHRGARHIGVHVGDFAPSHVTRAGNVHVRRCCRVLIRKGNARSVGIEVVAFTSDGGQPEPACAPTLPTSPQPTLP